MQFCPYSVLWGAVKTAVQERRLPSSARPGAMMILLGIFCPFFWAAYFGGASRSDLLLQAGHSGFVILIGFVLMIIGLSKNN